MARASVFRLTFDTSLVLHVLAFVWFLVRVEARESFGWCAHGVVAVSAWRPFLPRAHSKSATCPSTLTFVTLSTFGARFCQLRSQRRALKKAFYQASQARRICINGDVPAGLHETLGGRAKVRI